MTSVPLFSVLAICTFAISCCGETGRWVVERPDTDTTNRFYVGNRAPLVPSPLIKMCLPRIAAEVIILLTQFMQLTTGSCRETLLTRIGPGFRGQATRGQPSG